MSPVRRQAIFRTNDGLLLTGPLGSNVTEIWIKIQQFLHKEMNLKMSSENGGKLFRSHCVEPFMPNITFHLLRSVWLIGVGEIDNRWLED